jgi:hypothetical protein
MLVEMLARKGRYRAEDFADLKLVTLPDLGAMKITWLHAIEEARRLVRQLPPEDAGCLYWNPVSTRFETPDPSAMTLIRHFGSKGGILPTIGDEPVLADDGVSRRLLEAELSVSKPPHASPSNGLNA